MPQVSSGPDDTTEKDEIESPPNSLTSELQFWKATAVVSLTLFFVAMYSNASRQDMSVSFSHVNASLRTQSQKDTSTVEAKLFVSSRTENQTNITTQDQKNASAPLKTKDQKNMTVLDPIVEVDPEENKDAFVGDSLLIQNACSVHLAPGIDYPSNDKLDLSQYTASPINISARSSLPTCSNAKHSTDNGLWAMSCNTCSNIATCKFSEAIWLADDCKHKDFVGIGKTFRKEELHNCLKSHTLIILGDSTLRGPAKRMIAPFVSPEEVAFWSYHSYSTVQGSHGISIFWDYINKGSLSKNNWMGAPKPEDALKRMVDNHINPFIWRQRKFTFVIGGLTSYVQDFLAWFNSCYEKNSRHCPWRKTKGMNVVVQGATPSNYWKKCLESADTCFQYKKNMSMVSERLSLEHGFGFIDIASVSAGLWSALIPGDARGCGCHFCSEHNVNAAGYKPRDRIFGNVCATISNLLATEICDGERTDIV